MSDTSRQSAPHAEIAPIAARAVRLQLWGLTESELRKARESVSTHPSYHSWNIVDTTQEVGGPSPIRAGAPGALGHRAWYGWAWAAYHVTATKSV